MCNRCMYVFLPYRGRKSFGNKRYKLIRKKGKDKATTAYLRKPS